MGSFANYWEDLVLDTLFNKQAWTEVTIWVGLSTADPGDDAAGLAEPTAASYGRQETSAATWTAAGSGALDNTGNIEFTIAVQSWCTVSHFALFDASTAGNMLAHGALTTSRDITTNDSVRFADGELDIALD